MANALVLPMGSEKAHVDDAAALLKALGLNFVVQTDESEKIDKRDVDYSVVAGIVLAIPGAITALIELKRHLLSLKDRPKIRERIEPPLTRLAEKPGTILRLEGQEIDLGQATVDEVLDALVALEFKQNDGDTSASG